MIRTSVAAPSEVLSGGLGFFPETVTLENYKRAWEDGALGQSIIVGLANVFGILALQLVTCIPAAYVLAKVPRRWGRVLLTFVLAGLLVPTQVILVPLFIGVNAVGLADSLGGLILPFATSAFGIYMLRQQMLSIPDTLLEAAKTDGLGTIRTLISIVIPMAAPGIAAFSIFSIFVHWNDYIWPLLVARSPELRTPPLALAVFQQADAGMDYTALTAGAAIVTAPIVLLFLVAQKHFVQGMSGAESPS
ncbi:carbohydrate ABC transporter permease [Leucobacter salsicius]|uniref:carbohydrate ABC transporter permease n=1 Tax=Leucobacter salsicius TaxID=664638 RepID=UPI000A05F023|nr:carbohydrate ABC transporter permease [Leucobacter salsicius]